MASAGPPAVNTQIEPKLVFQCKTEIGAYAIWYEALVDRWIRYAYAQLKSTQNDAKHIPVRHILAKSIHFKNYICTCNKHIHRPKRLLFNNYEAA